uniref:TPA induced trans-membrane protein n=1 Tax=Saimiri boliviensis boliviensis TaxID=39432 RepID=A0A2K6SWD9_SAIBB
MDPAQAAPPLELSALERQPAEHTPLNGAFRLAEVAPLAEANKERPWSSCNKNVVGRCKLWMIVTSVFLGFITVIIVGLCLDGVTYITEECVAEEDLPHLLTERLTPVYSTSPSLSRYFTSLEIVDFSGENATVTYHLQFGVPSDDENFMKYMMSEELVLGILLQDFHDQNIPGCENLGLDPASLLLDE